MSLEISRQTLEIPAWGRNFKLGTLYDCRTDKIVPGISLWNNKDLKEEHLDISRNSYTNYTIFASDKLSEKLKKLQLNGSLQISILAGLIGLKGSANFLNKQSTTHRESSIHVRCQHRTVAKTLTMHHLGEGKIPYLEVAQTGANNSATHVVTEIQYGAEATFTFRKRINESEDRQTVNGQLNACGNMLVKVLLGALNAQGAGGSEITEQNNYTDVECQFEGDFKLSDDLATPTNYDEAIKFARQFSHVLARSMVKDERNESLGVPCLVSLYPLGLLPGVKSAPILAQEISEITASMCVRLVEDYDDLEEEVADLLNDSLVGKLRPLRKKLEFFQQHFSAFRAKLKFKLRNMLVQIRSGEEEISSLEKLLNYIRTNNFFLNPDRIALWLRQKHEELCMVMRFRDELVFKLEDQERILFFPKEKVLREQMSQSTVRHAIHFVFTSLRNPDPFLELVTQQTPATMDEIGRNTQPVDVSSSELWYRDNNIVARIEQELMDFHGFIEANTRDQGLVFAMTALDEDLIELVNSGASVFVYQKGILQERNYELLTEPHSVTYNWDDDSNQLISFSPPIRGYNNIVRYKIAYGEDKFNSDFIDENFFIIPYRKMAEIQEQGSSHVTITAECNYGSGPPHVFSIGNPNQLFEENF